jgi:hypothetical protein
MTTETEYTVLIEKTLPVGFLPFSSYFQNCLQLLILAFSSSPFSCHPFTFDGSPAFPGQLLKDRFRRAYLIPVAALNLLRSILRPSKDP